MCLSVIYMSFLSLLLTASPSNALVGVNKPPFP